MNPKKKRLSYFSNFNAGPYLSVLLIIIPLTFTMRIAEPFIRPVLDLTNVALFYLLPVLWSAVRWGRGPSIFAALVSVFCFDVLFVPPHFSVSVADLRYLFVFAVFLLVAIINGTLASRLRDQAESARKREARTSLMSSLSRQLSAETDIQSLLKTIVTAAADAVDGEAAIYSFDGAAISSAGAAGAAVLLSGPCSVALEWAREQGQIAGHGTETFADTDGLFFPLVDEDRKIGVLAVWPSASPHGFTMEHRQLMEAFANLASITIARLELAIEAQKAKHAEESEKLRTALFNSVSHDLRTPLASITGAVTSLQEEEDVYSSEDRLILIQSIREGASQLSHLVSNLLDTARLESGMLRLNKDWCDVQDIIGVALRRSHEVLRNRPLDIEIPPELPLVQADFSLIEQVIINLFYNAVKYSPPRSGISLTVRSVGSELTVAVGDKGFGISGEDRERVFDKFYRLYSPKHVLGTGLGLSICKGFVEAHGGHIWVEAGSESGSTFIFTLPLDEQPTIQEPVRSAVTDDR